MRVIKVDEVYRCSFCGKLYQLKHYCKKHEAACWKNPENHTCCFDCSHYEAPHWEHDEGDVYGDGPEFVSHYCSKDEVEMLSKPQIAKKSQACYRDVEMIEMPQKCDDFNLKYDNF